MADDNNPSNENSSSVPPPFGREERDDVNTSNETPQTNETWQSAQYQPPPQAGAYYSNTQGFVASGPQNDPFAVTALVLGIIAICSSLLLIFCCPIIPILGAIPGMIFALVSLNRIKNSNGTLTGRGMALAGLICSMIAVIIFGIFLVLTFFVTT